MAYRNGNYAAFYVDENQIDSNFGLDRAKDYCYYKTLNNWKDHDWTFPFIDSHEKTYNVRDSSDWETTLKPRLHERLCNSKNIILFLSNITRQSKALREEIIYGIEVLELPVIVVYPELIFVSYDNQIAYTARDLWDNLPAFKSRICDVPTAHVPFDKERIRKTLEDPRFSVTSKRGNFMVGF